MKTVAFTLLCGIFLLIYFNMDQGSRRQLTSPNASKDEPLYSSEQDFGLFAKRDTTPNWIWLGEKETPISIESFRGKVVYLNFWAKWCEPCVSEITFLNRIYKSLDHEKYVFLLFNLDQGEDEIAEAKKFLQQQHIEIPSYDSAREIFTRDLAIESLPFHVLLDKKGRMASKIVGELYSEEKRFKALLQSLESE